MSKKQLTVKQEYEEYLRQPKLADDIPFVASLDNASILLTSNNNFVAVIKIEGVDLLGLDDERKENLATIKKNIIDGFREEFRYSFYHIRRKRNASRYSDSIKSPLHKAVIEKWESSFEQMYETQTYLEISFNREGFFDSVEGETFWGAIKKAGKFIKPDFLGRKKPLGERGSKNALTAIEIEEYKERLNAEVRLLSSSLSEFGVTRVKNRDLFMFYDQFFNPHDRFVPMFNNDNYQFNNPESGALIAGAFCRSTVTYNRKEGIIEYNGHENTVYSSILSLEDLPTGFRESLLLNLLNEKIEFHISNRISVKNKERVKTFLKNEANNISGLPLGNHLEAKEIDLREAISYMESESGAFFGSDITIQIFARSKDELKKYHTEIRGQLEALKVTCHQEKSTLRLKFLSQLPDNEHLSARSRMLSTDNIANLASLYSYGRGATQSPFGNIPICCFRTNQKTKYNFTFHIKEGTDDPMGNTLIVGATGTGKTCLVSFLLMNAIAKYENLKVLSFDSASGLKIATTSFGGSYSKYMEDKELQLNPMLMDDTPANRGYLEEFITLLAGGADEYEKQIIREAIDMNYDLAKEGCHRSLFDLKRCFIQDDKEIPQSKNKLPLHMRLNRWIPDQKEGEASIHQSLFNAKTDTLSFDKRLVCFDMEHALKGKTGDDSLYPLASYIFHKFHQKISGDPHIVLVDEMWKYFDNETFRPYIVKMFREIRKASGIFLGLIQEPSALSGLSEDDAEIIRTNAATMIFFPNSRANEKAYKQLAPLTESEMNWIKTGGSNGRQVLIKKQDEGGVIIDVDLSPLGDHLKLFSSSSKDVTKFSELQKKYPKNFVEKYLQGKNAEKNDK